MTTSSNYSGWKNYSTWNIALEQTLKQIDAKPMIRLKRIKGYTGFAKWQSEVEETPIAYLARVQVEDIPSPYSYSPSIQILRWGDKDVVVFETAHKTYDIFAVPPELLRFQTEEQATDWHIKYRRN